MQKIFILVFLLFPSLVFADDDLIGKKFLCTKLLWGFEFISSDKVNVISTDLNKITNVKKYFYETNSQLSYINLYLNQKNIRDAVFSIHQQTFRVDIWTMTSGGNTSREIIPAGFCEEVKINDMIKYIEYLKNHT